MSSKLWENINTYPNHGHLKKRAKKVLHLQRVSNLNKYNNEFKARMCCIKNSLGYFNKKQIKQICPILYFIIHS